MADAALRFLHASDLHLDRAFRGLTEVPDAVRSPLVDAPYRAAERVLALAIEERVDFVVLSGDVCDPLAAGSRGLALLSEAFSQLSQKGIPVYWVFGRAESEAEWLSAWQLPAGVHRFTTSRWETIDHVRDGSVVARLSCIGFHARGHSSGSPTNTDPEIPHIVIAYLGDAALLTGMGRADYFALGGRHDRHTDVSDKGFVHYPGTPQGRSPSESGPHGCTIVEIDTAKKVRTRFVPTDRVRWLPQMIHVDVDDAANLRTTLLERQVSLASANLGILGLAKWTITAPPKLGPQLTSGTLAGELTNALRAQSAVADSGIWTVSVDAAESDLPVDMYEQENLLGELLRSIQLYEENLDQPLELDTLIGEKYVAGSIGSTVAIDDVDSRLRALRGAARLATDLLTSPEPRS